MFSYSLHCERGSFLNWDRRTNGDSFGFRTFLKSEVTASFNRRPHWRSWLHGESLVAIRYSLDSLDCRTQFFSWKLAGRTATLMRSPDGGQLSGLQWESKYWSKQPSVRSPSESTASIPQKSIQRWSNGKWQSLNGGFWCPVTLRCFLSWP